MISILKTKDATLKRIIESVDKAVQPEPSVDIYFDLLQSIVSQQLSVKVAAIIWQRFLTLFPDEYPTDRVLKAKADDELRAVGLSRQKANYLRNVAVFSIENGMGFETLNAKPDEEIISYLTQIKGVGKWTVQMVLMFPMDRPNVFPIDDLGIQTKMIGHYNLVGEKKEIRKKMLEIAEKWEPHKSLASKYLWNSALV
ncbi:MAG: DNA-3-methyladenine glycosylase 2 family protein [Crocinitomix sp.]|nr:DNA-3-methyladenine glycosylase 2 family protein [Crocinitomix sp.]